jgi:hypothetical protein
MRVTCACMRACVRVCVFMAGSTHVATGTSNEVILLYQAKTYFPYVSLLENINTNKYV